MSANFNVPGIKRTRRDETHDNEMKSGVIEKGFFDTATEDRRNDLLMPMVRSTFKEGRLEINILASFFKKWNIKPEDDVSLNYQVGLDKNGGYQLQIYLYTERKQDNFNPNDLDRELFYFKRVFDDIDLQPNSEFQLKLYDFPFFEDQEHIKTKQIKSVLVFVINTNPETSRGTETTVQPGVGT